MFVEGYLGVVGYHQMTNDMTSLSSSVPESVNLHERQYPNASNLPLSTYKPGSEFSILRWQYLRIKVILDEVWI